MEDYIIHKDHLDYKFEVIERENLPYCEYRNYIYCVVPRELSEFFAKNATDFSAAIAYDNMNKEYQVITEAYYTKLKKTIPKDLLFFCGPKDHFIDPTGFDGLVFELSKEIK